MELKRLAYFLVAPVFILFTLSAIRHPSTIWHYIIPFIFGSPYLLYSLGLSLKKKERIILFYSIFPALAASSLIVSEIGPELCNEGNWCWIIGHVIIALGAILSIIIGIIRFFTAKEE